MSYPTSLLADLLDRLAQRDADLEAGTPLRDDGGAVGHDTAAFGVWVLRHSAPGGSAPHLAVVGPTQTGKSSLVNLLLGRRAAAVSPLAGFTVRPEAFAVAPATRQSLPGLSCVQADRPVGTQAGSVRGDAPCGTEFDAARGGPAGCIIWDTPDFDSLAARAYQHGFLEILALADAWLLVLSKEKYADATVWSLLRAIEPLARPLVVCLNKLTADSRDAVLCSFRARLREQQLTSAVQAIVALPDDPQLAAGPEDFDSPDAAALRAAVVAALAAVGRRQRVRGVAALLRARWDQWTGPVRAQHAAQAAWRSAVAQACQRATQAYRAEFLERPDRFDSFRRATLDVLHLLEIPGVAQSVAAVRAAVTWPLRKAWSALRRLGGRGSAGGSAARGEDEAGVLEQLFDRTLLELERGAGLRAAEEYASEVWSAVRTAIVREEEALRQRFRAAVADYRRDFEGEIRRAAQKLYASLQEQPALLNTLRAARAATDVASLALVVKTGGLSPHDALLAPAMFSLTSMLAESAVGTYMRRIVEDLKDRQQQAVAAVIEATLARPLMTLCELRWADGAAAPTPEELAAAERALADLEACGDA